MNFKSRTGIHFNRIVTFKHPYQFDYSSNCNLNQNLIVFSDCEKILRYDKY